MYYTYIILHWRERTLERDLPLIFSLFHFLYLYLEKKGNQFLNSILNSSLFGHCMSRGSAGEYEADEQAGVARSAGDYQADEQENNYIIFKWTIEKS